MAAQSGIAGSARVGRNCMIAAQVGIVGHLHLGNNIKIAGQSGVTTNLQDDAVVFGSPAIKASKYKKAYVHFRNLQKYVDKINELEKKIKNLEDKTK